MQVASFHMPINHNSWSAMANAHLVSRVLIPGAELSRMYTPWPHRPDVRMPCLQGCIDDAHDRGPEVRGGQKAAADIQQIPGSCHPVQRRIMRLRPVFVPTPNKHSKRSRACGAGKHASPTRKSALSISSNGVRGSETDNPTLSADLHRVCPSAATARSIHRLARRTCGLYGRERLSAASLSFNARCVWWQ